MATNEGPFNAPLVVTTAVPNIHPQQQIIAPQLVYQQPVSLQVGIDQQSQQQIQALAQPVQYAVQPQQLQQQVVVVKRNLEGMTKGEKELFIAQQMMLNGGFCWRMTLIILWSIGLAVSIVQLVMGSLIVYEENNYYWSTDEEYVKSMVFALLLPGIIGTIAAAISIYAVTRYHYVCSVISCVLSGSLLLDGLIIFSCERGWEDFVGYYLLPFIYFSCIFAFSIVFTKKLAIIRDTGSVGDLNADCCKGCYECCGCCKDCCKLQSQGGCCQGQGEGGCCC